MLRDMLEKIRGLAACMQRELGGGHEMGQH